MPILGCGPSAEKLFDKSIQTEELTERKKLREELAKKYPDHAYGIFAKAYLLGANGEQEHYLEQLQLYTAVIKMQPNLSYAYVNRGIIRENLKLQADAMNDYTKGIELNPNMAYAYLMRGRLRMKLNDLKNAVVDFGMAISLKPQDHEAYLMRGRAYNKQGMHAEALSDLDIAHKITKDSPNVLFERGAAKVKLKDYSGAKADFSRVNDANPNLKAAAELNIGLIMKEEGSSRTEYCLHFGNAYQRDRKLAASYYEGHCS